MTETDGLARLEAERQMRLQAEGRDGGRGPHARLAAVVDPSSLFEIGALATSQLEKYREETPSDGVVAGYARISGREVAVLADDPIATRRSDGQVGKNKRLRLLIQALQGRIPILYLADGAGTAVATADVTDGRLLGRYSDRSQVIHELRLSERSSPVVSVLLGECAGSEASLVALADVIIATPSGRLVASPGVPRESPNERPMAGEFDVLAPDEQAALATARCVLELLPDRRRPLAPAEPVDAAQPFAAADQPLSGIEILAGLLDAGTAVRFDGGASEAMLLGLGRLWGWPVGFAIGNENREALSEGDLVALQRLAGLCARVALPLVLVQNGGTYASMNANARSAAYIREVAKTAAALQAVEAPVISLITRSGLTMGDFVLGGRELGTCYIAAFPSADVSWDDLPAFTREDASAIAGHGPWRAAGAGLVDNVIEPNETRAHLAGMLALVQRMRDFPSPASDRGGRIPFR